MQASVVVDLLTGRRANGASFLPVDTYLSQLFKGKEEEVARLVLKEREPLGRDPDPNASIRPGSRPNGSRPSEIGRDLAT